MNASITDPLHPSIIYYDSDYPSKDYPVYPENFDDIVWEQGIADDVDRYKLLIAAYGNNVLELCCGTGRVAIPLVIAGCQLTAVDVSAPLLKQFQKKIADIPHFPIQNQTIVQHDVTTLSLAQQNFDVVICAFNSLLCIADRESQQQTLHRAAAHLKPGGLLAVDIWNPFAANLQGDPEPAYFFSRRRIDNGNTYSRYAATGPMDANQVQSVYGWYDETDSLGQTIRTPYTMEWRLIFRYELELMLEKAGFEIKNIYGGNQQEPLQPESLKMFVEAIRSSGY